MSITQDGRLLRIDTPLGKDYLLLNELQLTEELSDLFYCKVQLLHGEETKDFEPTEIDAPSILGQNVTITLEQRDGTSRKLNGIVNSFSRGDRDTRFSYYQATIVPKIWLLTQTIQSRIFQHKSVPEIVKEVLEGFDFSMQVQGDFKPRDYCVQYRESDFQFVCRILEEEGIYFYFEHSDTSHKMIIADTPESHQDAPTKNTITYIIKLDTEEKFVPRINNLWADYKLQTGKVAYRDYHFQTPTNRLETQQPSFYPVANNQNMEIYDYPGGYARKYDEIDRMGEEDANGLEGMFPDKQRTVKNTMNALDSQYNVLSGTGNCCSLIAGHKFKLIEHPNKKLNVQYIITSITHEAHQSPNYHSNEEEGEPYNNQFEIIPYGQGVPPYCPPLKTPKPIMQGCQTGIVVGPSGEEIFTDKYGRVKVEFHWNRDGKADPGSSCWIRVAKDLAGNKYGSMYIPRIGQEVIIDFIGGDPDRPIITGSVYNDQTMPHYELPKYKTLSYIKTRTSPDDGKGFNELRFEDKKDKEQVFIHSQKRMDTRVRGSFYETCGGNRQERIGVRTDNKPGGNLAITVGGNYDLHVKEAEYIGIDDKLNEAVKADVVEDYQGNQQTLVKTKRELNAQQIIFEASQKISLKVGGNCIVIDSSGITIAGTMVKINSGGFGAETGNPSIDDPLDAASADTGEPGWLDRPRTGGSRGRNRRQLNSQHYIAPPRPGEDARITDMRNTLQDSAEGRHALEVYDRYDVQPVFDPSDGSYYSEDTNSMTLDSTETPQDSALTFVHEMNHAEAANEGTSADIENDTRDEYVDTLLNEEVDGTVDSIVARDELADAGHDVSGSSFPLQDEYHDAYNDAVTDAQAANPNATAEELDEIGKEAGRDRVMEGFQNGEVIPSGTDEHGNDYPPYPDYYGDDWDSNHPTGGGGTP